MRRSAWHWFVVTLIAWPGAASADSWLPPRTEQYLSADGQWRLTVEPRGISSPVAYFSDQLADKPAPGGRPGDPQRSAIGTMMHRIGSEWQLAWREPLDNDVAPVEAVVLPGGAVLTLDNWHSMGYGPDAVVLYHEQGRRTSRFGLIDFLPRNYIMALPRSVSSLDWRGDPKALPDGRSVEVPVVVPGTDPREESVEYTPVVFEPALGEVRKPAGPSWERAVAAAQRSLTAQLQAEAGDRARFIAPLHGPGTNSEPDWHAYLEEAFFRLDPDWKDNYPDKRVLRMPGTPGYRDSEKSLRELLRAPHSYDPLMLAALDPDALVSRLEIEARGIKPGALRSARIYLALDAAHYARAEAALAPTGARLIQLDPAIAIPQCPERLATFLENEKAAAAEEAADAAFR